MPARGARPGRTGVLGVARGGRGSAGGARHHRRRNDRRAEAHARRGAGRRERRCGPPVAAAARLCERLRAGRGASEAVSSCAFGSVRDSVARAVEPRLGAWAGRGSEQAPACNRPATASKKPRRTRTRRSPSDTESESQRREATRAPPRVVLVPCRCRQRRRTARRSAWTRTCKIGDLVGIGATPAPNGHLRRGARRTATPPYFVTVGRLSIRWIASKGSRIGAGMRRSSRPG